MAARGLWLPVRRSSIPSPIMGREKALTLISKPMKATSQPVTVVPILAPKITPSAWDRVNSPALTKPMVATVMALDDCTTAVIMKPEKTP